MWHTLHHQGCPPGAHMPSLLLVLRGVCTPAWLCSSTHRAETLPHTSPNLGTTWSPHVPNALQGTHMHKDVHAHRHTHAPVCTRRHAHTTKAEIPVSERIYNPRGTTPPWEGLHWGSCQPCAQHLTLQGLRSRCHCAGAPGANIVASPGTAPAPPLRRPGEHHCRRGWLHRQGAGEAWR